MWILGTGDSDESKHPAPSAKQLLYAETARLKMAELKALLSRLTVSQQRTIISEVSGSIFEV